MEGLNASYSLNSKYSELGNSAISSIKYDGTEVRPKVKSLSVITGSPTKDGDTTWSGAPTDITKAKGTYRIPYAVSFTYETLRINETYTQVITVN